MMKNLLFTTTLLMGSLLSLQGLQAAELDGELRRWHRISLTFDGPSACEADSYNPFLNYTLDVTFTNGIDTFVIPGFFAADGNASESGATCGNKWRVYFTPQRMGTWTWTASFRTGNNIATGSWSGNPTAFDGESGSIDIAPTNKSGKDFRYHGRLTYRNHRYMRFAGSMDWYLMSGAGSPENFLAYEDFDGTFNNAGTDYVKTYTSHVSDWENGNPSWKGGQGKGIIGAVNYLSSQGVNASYILTFNVQGDGDDVWPFTDPTTFSRFDVSKLDQWEIVFEHMDHLGIVKHFLLQETENDQVIDGGALGPNRKVYYREMVARFGHHLGVIWNLGEENTNTDTQRKDHASYLRDLDAYEHLVQVHTYPWDKDLVFDPLLGYKDYEGASLQISSASTVDADTKKWVEASEIAGRQWVVFLSEIGPASVGVKPDDVDPEHNNVRNDFLWPHLMNGGSGVEWYFGYSYANNDLNCEDFRSREIMFQQTDHALELFRQVPFQRLELRHDLVDRWGTTCLALPGQFYMVHMPYGDYTNLYLETPGHYYLGFYNPRTGGAFQDIRTFEVTSPGNVMINDLPTDEDWVACVLRRDPVTAGFRVANAFEQGASGMDEGHAFPNPTTGLTTIALGRFDEASEQQLVIRSAEGREVRQLDVLSSQVTLDFADLPEGLYVWQLLANGRPVEQGRIVRMRY